MARMLYAGPTPDGTYISRRTDNDYGFAIAIIDETQNVYRPKDKDAVNGYVPNPLLGQWVSLSWHRSYQLAQKRLDQLHNRGERRVCIVPVIDGKPPVTQTNTESEEDTMKRSTPNTRNARTNSKVNAKTQGFPACYLGDTGNFRPGMDARAKSDLRAAVAGKRTGKELHRFTKPAAQKLLKTRGW